MQCRECGMRVASNLTTCPTCGAVKAFAPARQSGVQVGPAVSKTASGPAKPARAGLPLAGETFAERYRVEKYLGLGSLCNSYLCRDTAAGNREVVIKVMHARKAAEAGLADSFLFLAESVSKYDHKGIGKIHAWGRHEGSPYYAMDWIPGVPLRLWLMERLNLENRVLPGLGIIGSLLDIFEAVHERGCYGCLKPENVFVTLNGPVIMDFGVVGFLSPQEFEFNSYARRYLPYMAPEVRQDWGNLLPHSDYFSIGAILYEIMVGRAPAPQLRLPSELSRFFGIESDEIILKSMAAKPLDRFGTVETFKQAVVSLQTSLLHAAPPEGFPGLSPAASRRSSLPAESPPDRRSPNDAERDFAGTEPIGASPIDTDSPARIRVENPWAREKTPDFPEPGSQPLEEAPGHADALDGSSGFDDSGSGARTLILPKSDPEEGGKTLSAFARFGDRVVEATNAERRFPRGEELPSVESVSVPSPERVASPRVWEDSAETDPVSVAAASAEDEEEAEPVPPWLWISIALAGSCMVVLSAYFGLLHPH